MKNLTSGAGFYWNAAWLIGIAISGVYAGVSPVANFVCVALIVAIIAVQLVNLIVTLSLIFMMRHWEGFVGSSATNIESIRAAEAMMKGVLGKANKTLKAEYFWDTSVFLVCYAAAGFMLAWPYGFLAVVTWAALSYGGDYYEQHMVSSEGAG